jgi:DNA-binding transcriptional LysR family regulator
VSLLEGSDEKVLDWVRRGVVDFGCVVKGSGIDGPALADDEYVDVVDPGHRLAGQTDVSIDELSDDPVHRQQQRLRTVPATTVR